MIDSGSVRLMRIAGWCAIASGIVAVIGIGFLIAMSIGFIADNRALQRFGTLNDICIIIQYGLALPITLALHQHLKAHAPILSRAAIGIGITGMIAVGVLQFLLIVGVLTFEEQVGPVIVALLVIGVWLLMTGYLGRSAGKPSSSLVLSLLARFYLGYPIWAFWLGRDLLSRNEQRAQQRLSIREEPV